MLVVGYPFVAESHRDVPSSGHFIKMIIPHVDASSKSPTPLRSTYTSIDYSTDVWMRSACIGLG